jgi:hypothetical protein
MNLFRLRDSSNTNQKFNGCAWLFVVLVLACFAISPMAQAVTPMPDGGYPGFNTAEGDAALGNINGQWNTAIGFRALSFFSGNYNTATGALALDSIIEAFGNTATGYKSLTDKFLWLLQHSHWLSRVGIQRLWRPQLPSRQL